MKVKTGILYVAVTLAVNTGFAQVAASKSAAGISDTKNDSIKYVSQYLLNKKLPPGYESETVAALAHFPELKNVRIKFRIKKSFATLKTRPTILSMFMPKGHRCYVITISDHTIPELMPLTFADLPENARIGVIGHELSHVVDFSKKNTWQSLKCAIDHLSKTYLDSLEFNTDMICIEHGLGKNLESWSSYIRKTMHTVFWRGAGFVNKGDTHYERYMNPSTIERYIAKEEHHN